MKDQYLVADDAAAYLNISRARFFDFRRFIPTFPKPIKTRLNGSRPRLVWTPDQLDAFALSFWGGCAHG
ncbi:DNA-binding protein [Klebsiella pneumoniae]